MKMVLLVDAVLLFKWLELMMLFTNLLHLHSCFYIALWNTDG